VSHVQINHVTAGCLEWSDVSCHTYKWNMSHMSESCHTFRWVMSCIWMSHVTRMSKPWWVMSHIWWAMSHLCLSHVTPGSLRWKRCVGSFMCVTWLTHMCDMTHSYVWHDSFICVTWLIHMCDKTHSWPIHMRGVTHSYVWHDLFILTWKSEEYAMCAPAPTTTICAPKFMTASLNVIPRSLIPKLLILKHFLH